MLKGDDSIVTDGERVAVNTVSSPQLATAGTGDVLTGVIAALIATGPRALRRHLRRRRGPLTGGPRRRGAVGHDSVIAGDVVEAMPAGLAV